MEADARELGPADRPVPMTTVGGASHVVAEVKGDIVMVDGIEGGTLVDGASWVMSVCLSQGLF